jgi:cytochrome c biogenesis protein CcmG/thiol:disulfide interchange protein DsbE
VAVAPPPEPDQQPGQASGRAPAGAGGHHHPEQRAGHQHRWRWGPPRRGPLLVAALLLPVGAGLVALALAPREPPSTTAVPTRLSPVPTVRTYPAGTPAPTLRLSTLDGGTVRLDALRGRPVVVNFWASWCAPCARELPLLSRAQAAHRADGLALVGVLAAGDQPGPARGFARRHGATWPTGLDPGPGPSGPTMTAYGVAGLPETFFVRRDGTLASRQLGELTAASLDRQLAAILPR